MGGHGGLNILPQKRWNVYNYENREKVRKDEEEAAKEEQLKREQSRKRDAEFRLEKLRQARGLASSSSRQAATSSTGSESKTEPERKPNDSNHINLFEGIKIFDPVSVGIEAEDDKRGSNKKMKTMKKEAPPRVVTAEDEKYRLGYGVAGKGVKLPWYMAKPINNENGDDDSGDDHKSRTKDEGLKSSGKKTLEDLREERLRRERREKERERALVQEKRRKDGDALNERKHSWRYAQSFRS